MFDRHHLISIRRGAFALAASLLLLTPTALADDSDFFTENIPPNVVVMVDSSGSMREIMYPPSYNPADSTCAIFDRIAPNAVVATPEDGAGNKTDDDGKNLAYNCDANTNHCRFQIDKDHVDFVATDTVACPDGTSESNGYIERTFCGKKRKLYVDGANECAGGSNTWYSEWFVEWYFSPAADAHLIGNETNTSTDPTKIDANDNGTNFLTAATFPLYKRSRMTAAKQITKEVIYQTNSACGPGAAATCTKLNDRVRFGIAQFDGRDGGFLSARVDDYSSNRVALNTALDNMEPNDSTPLAEALFKVYTYFMSRTTAELPKGKDGTTVFPKYVYRESDGEHDATAAPPDPITCPNGSSTCPCQKHFVITISDGDPFNDHFTLNGDETEGFDDFQALIGDYNDDSETEEGHLANGTLYLDDVAMFMQKNDFRPLDADQEGLQNIDVYTVGFHLGPASLGRNLLQKTADVGNGKAFFGTQASEIRNALATAVAEIVEKTQSFTAATVPASRTADGNNFYSTYFRPRSDSPFWDGHLKNFKYTLAGEILTKDDKCVIGATPQSPPCPTSGPLRTTAEAVWDASEKVPDPIDRKLYTGSASSFAVKPPAWFTPGSPATTTMTKSDLGVDTAPHSRLEEKPYELPNPPSNSDLDELTEDLVSNLAGCNFGTRLGAGCTPRITEDGVKSLLGDIFHSNPVVVSSPNSRINDATYHQFARDFRSRDRVIYAGSNDGWVHGFLAGEWQTDDGGTPSAPLIPPRHDRGERSGRGGTELFGFMPSQIREKIWELPISQNGGGMRSFYGPDGTATAADVWIYRNVSGVGNFGNVVSPPTSFPADKLKEQWRTVLVGGLRQGGSGYYALDVSDPSGSTYNYPGYLWEFPCDDCANAINPGSSTTVSSLGLTPADYLGESWSDPVITRVRVKVNGQPGAHDRWVAIVGGGYDKCGDPNHSDFGDTFVGGECDFTNGKSRRGRVILMIDITTGELLAAKFYTPANVPATPVGYDQLGYSNMDYAFAAQPAVFDLDFDGYADVVYFGDLGGQLWKWVVRPVGHDPINNSGSNDKLTQPNWPFYVFFDADDHSATHHQSFYYPPTGALSGGKLILAFGAGDRADPNSGVIDATADTYLDGDNNRYYVVKDTDPYVINSPNTLTDAPPPVPAGDLIPIDLVDSGANSCVDVANAAGFFITGRDREKFITNSVIFLGEVITGSFLPADPATASCGATGDAFLYRFDMQCGAGGYPSNPGTEADKRRKAIGGGLPTRPRVSVGELNNGSGGGGGCANKVVVITSDGGVENDCPGSLPSSGVDIRSWRAK